VFDNRLDAVPLFVAAQATLTQHDQSRMYSNIEEFNEISRIYGKNRKIVIERIFPHRMICSTGQALA